MPRRLFQPLFDKKDEIWNSHSPIVTVIGQRYERAGMQNWSNNRLAALCRALRKTVWTVCAEAGMFRTIYVKKHDIFRLDIDRALIIKYWKANRWPVWAALHFDRFEQYVKTQQMVPGAVLLGVADGAAAQLLKPPKPKESPRP